MKFCINKTLIIAEAGVNYNGCVDTAKKMIDVASEAGADYVKFQTFNSEKCVSKYASQAKYQSVNMDSEGLSQLNMLKKLELNAESHCALIAHATKKDVGFLSTAFDLESIDLLESFNLDYWKVPSGEITNLPYLEKIGSFCGRVILSTGMSTMSEIDDAIKVMISSGTKKESITVLHCNTEYPTPIEDVNLKAMISIKNEFEVNVGYSDHTLGIEVPVAAVALGASIIEKHFTLDQNLQGPDHRASMNPDQLCKMVQAIRKVEKALGDGEKKPSLSECQNMTAARKSIVAACAIHKGEVFNKHNITIKRPGSGISPMEWYSIIGKIASRDYSQDELIEK